jgi:hypothetical protein
MANALYDPGRQKFLEAAINWTQGQDDIRVVLVSTIGGDNPYTFSAAHEFLSSIHADARRSTVELNTSRTVTSGVADAADVTFTAVTGAAAGAVVIYKHNADAGAAALIAYIDDATGLPVTPNGGDITVQWDNGANKIFKL